MEYSKVASKYHELGDPSLNDELSKEIERADFEKSVFSIDRYTNYRKSSCSNCLPRYKRCMRSLYAKYGIGALACCVNLFYGNVLCGVACVIGDVIAFSIDSDDCADEYAECRLDNCY